MSLVSAGLLLYQRGPEGLRVFLAHPGGPYFARKDAGSWTIPKGQPLDGEALENAALREFEEEIGLRPDGELTNLIALGSVRQRSGKLVHAWGWEATLPADYVVQSNLFELEWPPRSGKKRPFPEVDRAMFFSLAEAQDKILPAQKPFLDRLSAHLATGS